MIAILVAVFLIPAILGVICFLVAIKAGFMEPKVKDLSYRSFWRDIVRNVPESRDSWWARILFCKYNRLSFIVSLFFVWGYVLLIFGWAIGWLSGIIWRFICAVGSGIGKGLKKVYEAI